MKGAPAWLIVMGGLAVMLAACSPTPPTTAELGYPPDFALVFTVEHDHAGPAAEAEAEMDAGADADADGDPDPLRMPAQHLVLPDRTLRVALGPGATHDYYPATTAHLTPEQMVELYRIVRGGDLLEPVDDPVDLEPGELRYRLSITVNGYRRRYVTTPDARPAAEMLLRRLVELRGGQ